MLYDIDKRTKRSNLNPGFWRDFSGRDVLSDFETNPQKGPATNILSNNEEFVIEVAAPGMCKDDYEIKVDNDRLTVIGRKEAKEDEFYTQREFNYGHFNKTFSLPQNVKSEEIGAACRDGILTIHLPKQEPETSGKHREIEIG